MTINGGVGSRRWPLEAPNLRLKPHPEQEETAKELDQQGEDPEQDEEGQRAALTEIGRTTVRVEWVKVRVFVPKEREWEMKEKD